jgi:hypothetical protein
MWGIRSISDASMGIPWSGSGAVGKAAFILVREVSVRPDMVILGRGGGLFHFICRGVFHFICRELSRDSTRDRANKLSLELCTSIVHIFFDGWSM